MYMDYINTITKDFLMQDVSQFLNLSIVELFRLFETIYAESEKEPETFIENFLANRKIDKTLKRIQMFHLSRRLNGTDLHDNNNLEQLLLNESPLSLFLRKYGVTFAKVENHIGLYYKGVFQPLDDESKYENGNIWYIRGRLGYDQNFDYCVNGFAFREQLEKNDYFSALSKGPELVQNIACLFNIEEMLTDYCNNSQYYCAGYIIPLSEVVFDLPIPPKTNKDKTVGLIKQSLVRLYDSWRKCDSFGNLVLRLSDSAMIKPEWFICSEKIADFVE